jgi:hypothetical protein
MGWRELPQVLLRVLRCDVFPEREPIELNRG